MNVLDMLSTDEADDEAVDALLKALKTRHADPKAKPMPTARWKPVVMKALGVKKLDKIRMDRVVNIGVREKLWKIKMFGKISALELLPDPEPVAEPEPPPPVKVAPPVEVPQVSKTPPKDWDPPNFLDCGHLNWWTDEENAAAKKEKFCCMGGQKKRPTNPRHWKGKYRRPIPEEKRRTKAREEGLGFPGLCCDDEGNYIGGVVNDCRWKRTGKGSKSRCEVHHGS